MIKIVLIAAAVIVCLRFIYFQFILPVHLSNFPWYPRYEQIEAQISEVTDCVEHLEARRQVKAFVGDLSIPDSLEYRQCCYRLSIKLRRSFHRFSPKLKTV